MAANKAKARRQFNFECRPIGKYAWNSKGFPLIDVSSNLICKLQSRLVKTCITLMNTAMSWRSGSLKVINFGCNWKHIYDFLLVINCYLSSISHRFQDIASKSQRPSHHSLSSPSSGPSSNFVIRLGRRKGKATFWLKLHEPNLSRLVTIRIKRTTDQ